MDNDFEEDQLDPYFKSLPTLAEFIKCFPRHCTKVFPINCEFIWDHVWSTLNYQFSSFPSFDVRFFRWYMRLKLEMWLVSRQTKIESALEFCCHLLTSQIQFHRWSFLHFFASSLILLIHACITFMKFLSSFIFNVHTWILCDEICNCLSFYYLKRNVQ